MESKDCTKCKNKLPIYQFFRKKGGEYKRCQDCRINLMVACEICGKGLYPFNFKKHVCLCFKM